MFSLNVNSFISNNSNMHVNKVNWFQVLLCNINNSIKHQSFIYMQLNLKTILFQAFLFSINLIWFGFIAHQPLQVIDTKSIHINRYISNNSI